MKHARELALGLPIAGLTAAALIVNHNSEAREPFVPTIPKDCSGQVTELRMEPESSHTIMAIEGDDCVEMRMPTTHEPIVTHLAVGDVILGACIANPSEGIAFARKANEDSSNYGNNFDITMGFKGEGPRILPMAPEHAEDRPNKKVPKPLPLQPC